MSKIKKETKTYYRFYCPGCKCEHTYTDGLGGWNFNGDMDNPSFTPSLLNQTPVLTQSIIDGKIVIKQNSPKHNPIIIHFLFILYS